MIEDLAFWIYGSSASAALAGVSWVVPLFQSIHILAIAVVMGSMLFVNLRMLGVAGPRANLAADLQRFFPAIWCALAVLLFSGVILVLAEPLRELMNQLFRLKLILIVLVVVAYYLVQRKAGTDPSYFEKNRAVASAFAIGSFIAWIAIASMGRWIAFAGQIL